MLCRHRQPAVLVASGLGGHALGELLLEHEYRGFAEREQSKRDLARNPVREVGDTRRKVGEFDGQRVALHDSQATRVTFVSKFAAEEVGEFRVAFHDRHAVGDREQAVGEDARSATDFEHVVETHLLGIRRYSIDDSVVHEEVLVTVRVPPRACASNQRIGVSPSGFLGWRAFHRCPLLPERVA